MSIKLFANSNNNSSSNSLRIRQTNNASNNVSSVSYTYDDIAAPTPATVVGGRGAVAMTIPEDSAVHHGMDLLRGTPIKNG